MTHPAPSPDVSIVIVGYGASEWLDRCLRSLAGPGSPAASHEVLLVDNASTPPLRETLHADLSEVRLLELAHNVGFGAGCNLGLRTAIGRRVLFLNPDTEVLPGAVDALVEFLDADPRRGLVGGRTLSLEGELDRSSCWGSPTLWSQVCFATGLSTVFAGTRLFDPESLGWWDRDTEREVGVVTGCLLMGDREVLTRLGGFDETFFMYGEDVELSQRARRAGYRPSISPRATVVHAKGATSTGPAKVLMVMRGKATLYRLGAPRPRWWASRALLVAGVAMRAAKEGVGGGDDRRWRDALQQRSDWLRGWAAVARPPLTVRRRSEPVRGPV